MLRKLILVSLPILIIACKKPDQPVVELAESCVFNTTTPCEDLSSSSENITLGNLEGMHVFTGNKIAKLTTGGNTIIIDVDCDGIPDFKFSTIQTAFCSYYVKQWVTMDVECLNTASFLHYTSTSDTTFYHKDSYYFSGGSGTVKHIITEHYKCFRNSAADSITNVTEKNFITKTTNAAIINNSDNWLNIDSPLHESTYTPKDPVAVPYNADTTIWMRKTYHKSCDNMLPNTFHYVPFKKIICGQEKMGWFKIKSDGVSELTLVEVAMQR